MATVGEVALGDQEMPNQNHPNLTLRQAMADHGVTHEMLADQINQVSEELTGTWGACTARHVGRWLSGTVVWPWSRYRAPLEHIFGRSAVALGFISPASNPAIVREPVPEPTLETPVLRRQFVLGLTGVILALPALPESGRLGMSDVSRIQTAATQLHQLDDRHGGEQLADVAARYIEHVEHASRSCTYGGNVQTHLHRTLGEMAASAGWFAFDADRHDTARRWWDTGLRYALLADNKQLQARIWSSMSHQACELGHGAEAVSIAQAALKVTRGRRDGHLSALLHTRVARGHAVQDQAGRCGQSLHRAEQEFDQEASEPQRWLGFFTAGELSSAAALCQYDLRQYAAAVRDAHASLRAVQSTPFRRNELSAHVRLARSLVAAGELDAAIASADDALTLLPTVRSPRIGVRVKELRDVLLDRSPAGATEFSERYEAVATCP